jgi:hypothetical protein
MRTIAFSRRTTKLLTGTATVVFEVRICSILDSALAAASGGGSPDSPPNRTTNIARKLFPDMLSYSR